MSNTVIHTEQDSKNYLIHNLRVIRDCQIKAIKSGIPLDQALRVTNDYQVQALNAKVPLDNAVRIIDDNQLNAAKDGLDVGLLLRQSASISPNISPKQVSQINNGYQFEAYTKAGVPLDKALKITNAYQVIALKVGVPFVQAVKISTDYEYQYEGIKSSDIPFDEALQVLYNCQVMAIGAGLSFVDVLEITSCSQEITLVEENSYVYTDMYRNTNSSNYTYESAE